MILVLGGGAAACRDGPGPLRSCPSSSHMVWPDRRGEKKPVVLWQGETILRPHMYIQPCSFQPSWMFFGFCASKKTKGDPLQMPERGPSRIQGEKYISLNPWLIKLRHCVDPQLCHLELHEINFPKCIHFFPSHQQSSRYRLHFLLYIQ